MYSNLLYKIVKKKRTICVSCMYGLYLYAKIQVNRFKKGFDIVQKLRKYRISIGKIFK